MKAAVLECANSNWDYKIVDKRCKLLGVGPVDICSAHIKYLRTLVGKQRKSPVRTIDYDVDSGIDGIQPIEPT